MKQPLTAEHVAAVLARHPGSTRYWIAFSGGMDSTTLLHLCHTLAKSDTSLQFAAAHIHHGLHCSADAWVTGVEDSCRAWGFPLEVRHVDARPAAGESPEAAARQARYRSLKSLLHPGEVLLTAQHQDDQAETLLLQLLRGAGLAGLAAMPEWASFGPGFLCRPLLGVPRHALQEYASRHHLQWIDDPTNADTRFDRNYLRHGLLPGLRLRWPGLATSVSRSAAHCAEAETLLGEFAQELLHTVRHPLRNTLLIEPLTLLSAPRQRLILREWLRTSGCQMPSATITERVLRELLSARADRHPVVSWNQTSLRRHRGELHLLKAPLRFDARTVSAWRGDAPLPLTPANGTLRATLETGPGIAPRHWRNGDINVRYRQGGERLSLSRREGTRELKKLLQETGLAPWIRERVPLIYIDGTLAAVADLWISEAFEGDPSGENLRIHWDQPALMVDTQPPRPDPEP